MRLDLSPVAYRAFLADPFLDERLGGDDAIRLVTVHDDGTGVAGLPSPGSLPVVVAWVGDRFGGEGPDMADLVVSPEDVDLLAGAVAAAPLAASAVAVLLRSVGMVDVDAGLAMESAVYSTLQAGPEFAAWRARRVAAEDAGSATADGRMGGSRTEPVVRVDRTDTTLAITLDRPDRHNAIDRRLRDELYAALALAVSDDSIRWIELRGAGPSFCSGGDLDEFGLRPDPATAHATRLARSPARLLHRLRARTTVHVHGATLGGGIEMAAFADEVVADPDVRIGLPEIRLGLIPGAGGTVSLTRRVGRQRTAALALTGVEIDAPTALEWGLVDEIDGAGGRVEVGAR